MNPEIMKIQPLKILSKDEIQLIHENTLELLQTLGVRVESEEAQNLLVKNGATSIKRDNKIYILFPEDLVKEQLKKVPNEFTLYGPDGSYSIKVNLNAQIFSTFGAAMKIHDSSKRKKIRNSTLKDLINQIKIVNKLDNIDCSHLDIWPGDVPYTVLHCHSILQWAKHGIKPFGMACFGRTASQDMINMASIISGGTDELKKKPRLLGVFNPTSPLLLPQILLNGLFVFAKHNQPMNITSAAGAGSTAPVTLAGLLVQTNMEILASIVLTQLINPGTPVLYGSTNTIMDPLTGNMAYGSTEFALITIGSAQLAHYYKIPSKGSGLMTDSKCFDLQNGFERYLTLLHAALAGHNYITCAGTYESSITEALELLIIDDDLIGMVKRELKGITVNSDTLAREEIERVALSSGNYLGTKHSAKYVRKEIFVPSLVDRKRRGAWMKEGEKDIMERAREKMLEILREEVPSKLEPPIEQRLIAYLKGVSSRTVEDYRKLEGMEAADVPETLSQIKKKNEK